MDGACRPVVAVLGLGAARRAAGLPPQLEALEALEEGLEGLGQLTVLRLEQVRLAARGPH